MEQVVNFFKDTISWAVRVPFDSFWILLPAVLAFLWGAFRIVKLYLARKEDNAVIEGLISYQSRAKEEGHEPATRRENYIKILSIKRGTISILLYKYMVSHDDFSEILAHFSYPEYIKVYRQSDKKRPSGARPWFHYVITLFLIWGVIVSVVGGSDMLANFTGNGALTREASNAVIISSIVVAFWLATMLLVYFFARAVRKYKQYLLEDLQSGCYEFFTPIGVEYKEFAVNIIDHLQPSLSLQEKIRRLVVREGRQFRQIFHDLTEGVEVGEEEELAQRGKAKKERKGKKKQQLPEEREVFSSQPNAGAMQESLDKQPLTVQDETHDGSEALVPMEQEIQPQHDAVEEHAQPEELQPLEPEPENELPEDDVEEITLYSEEEKEGEVEMNNTEAESIIQQPEIIEEEQSEPTQEETFEIQPSPEELVTQEVSEQGEELITQEESSEGEELITQELLLQNEQLPSDLNEIFSMFEDVPHGALPNFSTEQDVRNMVERMPYSEIDKEALISEILGRLKDEIAPKEKKKREEKPRKPKTKKITFQRITARTTLDN